MSNSTSKPACEQSDHLRRRIEELEAELLEERHLLQAFMDNVPDNIYFKDRECHFIRVNRAMINWLGVEDPQQPIGKCDRDFFTSEHAEQAYRDEQEIMQTGQPMVYMDEKETWPDGRETWVTTTKLPLRDQDENIIGTFGISRDVTERVLAERELHRTAAELARSNQDLTQFAYLAAHDLQEPLRAVASYCELLNRRYQGRLDDAADEYIKMAVEGTKRMQALINNLLEFSRVEMGELPLAAVESDAVFAQAVAHLQVMIGETAADVTRASLPRVTGDQTQLVQLLQNLIGNGIKFHGERPPSVHVDAKRQDGAWLFSVRDNGIGIRAEYIDQIFGIFERLHSRDDYPGTGIGLALCKKIVERHGGEICAESAPGEGCTVYFTLPACD